MSDVAIGILVRLLPAFAVAGLGAQSTAPVVRDVARDPGDARRVELTLSWPNAFRSARNHDAAWLVVRGADARRGPLRLSADGHALAAATDVPASMRVVDGGVGAFAAPAAEHRGDVSWRLSLQLAEPAPDDLRVWAVGMVFVPGGAFELGDDDATALRFGAFHRRAADGEPAVFAVDDEGAVAVGDTAGALRYRVDERGYHGDGGGPIPAAWPKGTRAFYVMKHELRQGEYAAFVDALPAAWRRDRGPFELRGAEAATCSIRRDGDRVVADAPARPCNFVTWADTCALFDWLALRPMTEFEFEKAARGPRRPMPADYPWGAADDARLRRVVQRSRDLAAATAADEAALTDDTRPELGASFYWVMDLSGSVWERVVSAGSPAGRAFRGSHGDGVLSEAGDATNDDWPRQDGDEAPGVGYRGGAEYFAERDANNPTNPHSPVAVRTYAGWGGAQRFKTYSARACRTAPEAPERRLEVRR